MRHFIKGFSTFVLCAFALVASTTGCEHIAEAIDCDQMCERMQDCVEGDLDVRRCAERCEDEVDDNQLSRKLDQCTDCMDRGYSCGEITDECSACDEVQIALLD